MPSIRPRTVALAWLVVVATSVGASSSPDQQPASGSSPPTGLILGRTVDGVSGAPIGSAAVTIAMAPAPAAALSGPAVPSTLGRFPQRVLADAAGRFVLHDLPKGSYLLTASKGGYANGAYGRRAASEDPQTLVFAEGERLEVTLSLWKDGAIGGTVVDEAAEPVVGVQVRAFRRTILGGHPVLSPFGGTAQTDDRGAYRIASLPPGDYLIGIVKTEIAVPTSFQQAWAASVGGGESQQFQRELERSAGLGSFSMVAGAGQAVGTSRLLVSGGPGNSGGAMPPPVDHGKVFVYPPVFNPGVTSPAQGTILTLEPSASIATVDFQLRPVPSSQVSGTLTGPQGPEPFTVLNLVPSSAADFQRDDEMVAASTVSDTNGDFTFLGVATGSYAIRALKIPPRLTTPSSMTTVIQTGTSMIMSSNGPSAPPPISEGPTLWASVPVSVEGRDIAGMQVQLATGARVTGRVEFEGTKALPTPAQVRLVSVVVEPTDGRANQFQLTRGSVDEAGQFKTYQFAPGRYVVRAFGAPPDWTLKGAFLAGRNVTDEPFEIAGKDVADVVVTFTDQVTELQGAVHNGQGPDAGATVIVFPQRAELWTERAIVSRSFRTARVASDSTYRVAGLPAGDYLAIAIDSAIPPDWQDPAFLQKLAPIAVHVTVADGEKKVQDVETRQIR